jgi:hypothetical protein
VVARSNRRAARPRSLEVPVWCLTSKAAAEEALYPPGRGLRTIKT